MASFFISRVDGAVDQALQKIKDSGLQGKIGIDNAKISYVRFREIFSSERWQRLAARGGRVQRPLWASTGTKNPAYPDTLYVDNLIGADTVNTLPPATLQAFLNHGQVSPTLEMDVTGSQTRLAKLTDLGVDLDAITNSLQDEGVAAFAKSFEGLMTGIAEKRKNLMTDRQDISVGAVS